eukprot:jgi/Tetstr1/437771/TSEL_026425.t1
MSVSAGCHTLPSLPARGHDGCGRAAPAHLLHQGSQPTQTDVEQSGAGLGEPLATIHEDEHGHEEEEEEEEEKEEEEEEGPITVGGVRGWHNDYEMRRGIQQIKNKRFAKSTNTCQPCQGSSAPRTVLVDNRYYQVVAATR